MRCLIFTLLFTPLLFAQSFTIEKKVNLPKKLSETSGIIFLDKTIITFNDSGGKPKLYVANPKTGKIKRTVKVQNAKNVDWEAITQDASFIYVGDTGNNYGNRKNLVIYKISKKDFSTKDVVQADKIHFSYQDQRNFKRQKHSTNFDCEAIVVYKNKLLVFTKNWGDYHTNIYELPLEKGTYTAIKKVSLNIKCMLTSVSYNTKKQSFTGTAYDRSYKSYLIKIKDIDTSKPVFKKINLVPTFEYANQIEAIAFKTNQQIYITREASKKVLNCKKYNHKQKLFLIRLAD